MAALSFGDHEDVVFAAAPLDGVVCQCKFQPVMSLLGDSGVAGFQEALRAEYPNYEKVMSTEVQISSSGAQSLANQAPVYRLKSADEAWTVSIAVDSVALETPRYTDFSEFLQRMNHVLKVTSRTLHPASTTRVGLRKINNLKHPEVETPQDWSRFLRRELVGILAVDTFPTGIEFSLADVRFRDEDNWMIVRHGLHPQAQLHYLLDIDYYCERPYEIEADGPLTDLLQHYSDGATNFFHWCLLPLMKEHLRPQPRDGKGV